MKITFYGAAGCVTGSCFLVEAGSKKILVDCGMFQGPRVLKERNYKDFVFSPLEIDLVILTHAHVDHTGLIPKLCKHGYKGEIWATPPTVDLCGIVLPDAGHIQEVEIERKNKANLQQGRPALVPIYTCDDARRCLAQFRPIEFDQATAISGELSLMFRKAGHILGAAMLEFSVRENGKIFTTLFTGDLGRKNQPIIQDPHIPASVDYLVIESTYGGRLHKFSEPAAKRKQLAGIINRALTRGGNIVVPAFAVERTQDFLLDLHVLLNEKQIPEFPIYIDSPMAVGVTEIFHKYPRYYDEFTTNLNQNGSKAIEFPNLNYSRTEDESRKINEIEQGVMVISASGMCEAGRIKHHLRHNIWRPESTILFIGYQAEGTLGRRLVEGEKMVKIHGDDYAVSAEIVSMEGFSGHADGDEIEEWIGAIGNPTGSGADPAVPGAKRPAEIILVHGEPEQQTALEARLSEKFERPVRVPQWLDSLTFGPSLKTELISSGPLPKPEPAKQEEYMKTHEYIRGNLERLIKYKVSRGDAKDLEQDLEVIDKFVRSFLKRQKL